jgi:hypothetical protein
VCRGPFGDVGLLQKFRWLVLMAPRIYLNFQDVFAAVASSWFLMLPIIIVVVDVVL